MSKSIAKTKTKKRKIVKPSERIFENAMIAIKDLRALAMPKSETEWATLAEQTSALLLAAEEYFSLNDFDSWADEPDEPTYMMGHTLPFDRPSKLWALVADMSIEETQTKVQEVVQRLQTLLETHMPQASEPTDQANKEGWDRLLTSIDFFRARQEAELLLTGLRTLTRGGVSDKPSASFGGSKYPEDSITGR